MFFCYSPGINFTAPMSSSLYFASIGIPESGGRRLEDPLRETRVTTCSWRPGSAEQIANRRRGHSMVRGSRHVLRWSRARRGPAPNPEGLRRRSADNGAGPARESARRLRALWRSADRRWSVCTTSSLSLSLSLAVLTYNVHSYNVWRVHLCWQIQHVQRDSERAHVHDHFARRRWAVHGGDGALAARRDYDRAARGQERRRGGRRRRDRDGALGVPAREGTRHRRQRAVRARRDGARARDHPAAARRQRRLRLHRHHEQAAPEARAARRLW